MGEMGELLSAILNNLAVDLSIHGKDPVKAEQVARTILDNVDASYLEPTERGVAYSVLGEALSAQGRYAEAAQAAELAGEIYQREGMIDTAFRYYFESARLLWMNGKDSNGREQNWNTSGQWLQMARRHRTRPWLLIEPKRPARCFS
jgi:ATP/maltotriose-dependent transcriptional regulator MalT